MTQAIPLQELPVQTWHSDPEGFYDIQREGDHVDLRGILHTDEKGRFEFHTVNVT